MNVTKTTDNFADVAKAINLLATTRVMAGVPSTKTARSDEPINNATLMYLHENGVPEKNIPARPVVHPAIASIQIDLKARFEQIGNYAMDGKTAAVEKGFNAVGLMAQNAMQERIVTGPFVPLKPATIAARKRAGFQGEKPLNRSGRLKAALTYVIRKISWVGK